MKLKKKYRKRIAWLITLFMMISIIPSITFGQENDVENHWASKAINKWIENGLVNGYSDGSFKPNNPITRAEFMVLANKAFKFAEEAEISFNDVKEDDWFTLDIKKGLEAGYITGYPDDTVRPKDIITRQEAAVILSKIMNLTPNIEGIKDFSDRENIPSWSKGYIGTVVASGYMNGYPDGSFKPRLPITRAEALVVLDKAMTDNNEVIENEINSTGIINKSGIYGPENTIELFDGNVYVKADGVTLQNMVIEGDLVIAEEVGEGEVFLNNITVKGDTYIRGGGPDSIYINGGDYKNIIIQKAGGRLRIVMIDERGTTVTVEEAENTEIIFEGTFENIDVKTGNVKLTIQGETNIKELHIDEQAKEVEIKTSKETVIDVVTLNTTTKVTNEGRIKEAKGSGANQSDFEINLPENLQPQTQPSGGGGGGGGSTPLPKASIVTATPSQGGISSGTGVVLSTDTEGAVIYYTLDESTPTDKSIKYTSPIIIDSNTVIKAIAIKSGMTNSNISTFSFTIEAEENNSPVAKTIAKQSLIIGGSSITLMAFELASDTDELTVTNAVYRDSGIVSLDWTNDSLLISPVGLGSTTVIASVYDTINQGIDVEFDVEVVSEEIPVNAITVTGDGGSTTITIDGGTLQMNASVTPANASNREVTWSVMTSLDSGEETGYATIDSKGLLKAVTDGIITVIATADDGSGIIGEKEITISNQNPVLEPQVSITAGSAVFQYEFNDRGLEVNYGMAVELYGLESAMSTVQLIQGNVTSPTNITDAIYMSNLNLELPGGTVVYEDLAEVSAAFNNEDFISWGGPPDIVRLNLSGNLGGEAWEINDLDIVLTVTDKEAFNSIAPSIPDTYPVVFKVFTTYSEELFDIQLNKNSSYNGQLEGGTEYVLQTGPSIGTLTLNVNGSFSYMAHNNAGQDSFIYTVDGNPEPQTVNIAVTEEDGTTIPVVGAVVAINQNTMLTNESGEAVFQLENGSYNYSVTAEGFEDITDGRVEVVAAHVTEKVEMISEVIEASIDNVVANNGEVTITLEAKPTVAPAEGDFIATVDIDNGGAEEIALTDFSYDGNVTVTYNFTPIVQTESEQSVVIAIKLGEQTVVSEAFTVAAAVATSISGASAEWNEDDLEVTLTYTRALMEDITNVKKTNFTIQKTGGEGISNPREIKNHVDHDKMVLVFNYYNVDTDANGGNRKLEYSYYDGEALKDGTGRNVKAPDSIDVSVPSKPITHDINSGSISINEEGTYIITGTGEATTNTITVAKDVDANITLNNVNIVVGSYTSAFLIENNSTGDVNITLVGENILRSGFDRAGLQKNGIGDDVGTLTIGGEGSLAATGGSNAAGIGGSFGNGTSNITINSGTIIATNGGYGAGIGGGRGSAGIGKNIKISGGQVTAIGLAAAGIGRGEGGSAENNNIAPAEGMQITVYVGSEAPGTFLDIYTTTTSYTNTARYFYSEEAVAD